jgi:hypothetical protein
MSGVRLGTSIVGGILGGSTALGLFYFKDMFGSLFSYVAVAIVIAVTFGISVITNSVSMTISNCPLDGGKISLNALYPVVPAGIVATLFFLIEPRIGLFAFPFNTIRFPFTITSDWRPASIFGLAFALFWIIIYGQILASAKSELCDN